jgi:hypothetical protein
MVALGGELLQILSAGHIVSVVIGNHGAHDLARASKDP